MLLLPPTRQLPDRRDFLNGCGRGLFGLGMGELLARQAVSAQDADPLVPRVARRAKSCIVIFLFGGPSHIDTWDMKPDAAVEYRGEFAGIATTAPGVTLCEHLPLTAREMHHVALIRGVTIGGRGVGNGDHHADTYYMLTGNRPDRDFFIAGTFRKPYSDDFPSLSSALASRLPAQPELPAVVQCPARSGEVTGVINPGQFGGKLGANWEPFMVRGELERPRDFQLPDLGLPADLDLPRLGRRRDLNRQLDELLSQVDRDLERFARFDTHQRRAFDLLTSNRARAAFDLSQESEATRRRYGNDLNGQSVLLARRLVEAGVPSVAVHWVGRRVGAGLSWDTHSDNFGQLKNVLLPAFDACYSALLEDLHDRGLLDETLVVVCTEMGRTPKVGDPRTGGNGPPGRDHWDHCWANCV